MIMERIIYNISRLISVLHFISSKYKENSTHQAGKQIDQTFKLICIVTKMAFELHLFSWRLLRSTHKRQIGLIGVI